MSIPVNVQAKTAAILEKEALFYGVNATAVAKAILDTVANEGLTHTILAGIDVESFQQRKRGRPRVKTGKRD
jgi:hypothetical protein